MTIDDKFIFDSDSVFCEHDGELKVNVNDGEVVLLINMNSIDFDIICEGEIDFIDDSGQLDFDLSSVNLNCVGEFDIDVLNNGSGVD